MATTIRKRRTGEKALFQSFAKCERGAVHYETRNAAMNVIRKTGRCLKIYPCPCGRGFVTGGKR